MRIKDQQLFAVNGLLVCVILAVLIVWEFIGAETVHVKLLEKEIYHTSDGTSIQPFVRVCHSEKSQYFNWTLRVIQGTLLTFGAFLAWETRRIRLEALNDSQRIGLCLYNVVVLSAVGVTLTLLLEDQEVLLYGITSGFLIFGTTTTQLIIFIPKIQAIANKVEVRTVSTVAARNAIRVQPSISAWNNTIDS
ncbi:gamma-aminobutyric acid type B receptor subunit 2-like [Ruditapes philippinarum]|uniref:gamma-aminobutyric acid type B receptor subunit 2-like n=1 Tax=Ruditapes philippinarum TaxID=129788 RepID=UPI00295B2590|nr:gamma-aminobutyric acid type B receptor subunit 2-like [Ruditapes philippinarum]